MENIGKVLGESALIIVPFPFNGCGECTFAYKAGAQTKNRCVVTPKYVQDKIGEYALVDQYERDNGRPNWCPLEMCAREEAGERER